MSELFTDVVLTASWTVLGYTLLLDSSMLALVLLGARRVAESRHWKGAEGHGEIFASPLTPAVSVLIPAHDEEAGILDTLRAALGQRSEEHTSELQSRQYLVCRLLLDKKQPSR